MPENRAADDEATSPARQIYCPYCQSSQIRILMAGERLTICRCKKCDADFTVLYTSAT